MGTVYRRPPAFMHPSARQVQGGSIDRKHPMPMPPPVRVGSDFPCVPGSGLSIEDHLEDCLVQGLEQLLVQPGPGTADGGRRHRSRLWQFDPHRPALPRAIAFEIYSSCRADRTMSRRKSVSQPARLSLPRMESLSGCTRAIFRASRRNSARLDGPWSLRWR